MDANSAKFVKIKYGCLNATAVLGNVYQEEPPMSTSGPLYCRQRTARCRHQHHPCPSLHGNTDRQTGSSCCQGNSQKVCGSCTVAKCEWGKKTEKNARGKASLWWWNLIRLWRGDKKGYFQLLKKEVCVGVGGWAVRRRGGVCVWSPICADTAGYLRLSLGIGWLTHWMTDKLWSPGNPAISFSHRPLLCSPPRLLPIPPSQLCHLSPTSCLVPWHKVTAYGLSHNPIVSLRIVLPPWGPLHFLQNVDFDLFIHMNERGWTHYISISARPSLLDLVSRQLTRLSPVKWCYKVKSLVFGSTLKNLFLFAQRWHTHAKPFKAQFKATWLWSWAEKTKWKSIKRFPLWIPHTHTDAHTSTRREQDRFKESNRTERNVKH